MNAYVKTATVRLKAIFGLNATALRATASAGALAISVRAATGYAAPDVIIIAPGTDSEETATIASVSGSTITLTTALIYGHTIDTPVQELVVPTTVTLKVKDPAGTTSTYTLAGGTVTQDSTGQYSKDVPMDTAGRWYYQWSGTGTAPGVEEGEVEIRAGHF